MARARIQMYIVGVIESVDGVLVLFVLFYLLNIIFLSPLIFTVNCVPN